MSAYRSLDQIKRANAAAGYHFFDADTLRFFKSRVSATLYGGRYFVTSERGPSDVRAYTVRRAEDDGSIQTVEPFNRLTRSAAHALAARLARADRRMAA